jgi:hypothetical protein
MPFPPLNKSFHFLVCKKANGLGVYSVQLLLKHLPSFSFFSHLKYDYNSLPVCVKKQPVGPPGIPRWCRR